MKFLAFTDIHGSYEGVDHIISLEEGVDGIIIGGDLTTYGSPEDGEKAIRVFKNNGLPVFAIAGNMDSPEFDTRHESLGVSINARGLMLGEIGLFGVSASPFTPMHTPYEIAEEEIARRAEMGWKDVSSAKWKIFVPHSPPRDTKLDKIMLGKHVGSGHIHESRGIDSLGKSKMVNCGPAGRGYYAVIEIGKDITVEARG
jgi:Icc-related predicted phosphoesterase